jgi:hypothetical protein
LVIKLKDGSTILPDSFSVDQGIEHDVPQPKSVPSGWTFDGVYLNVDGSGSAVTKFTPTTDTFTLYYKFMAQIVTVEYHFVTSGNPPTDTSALPDNDSVNVGVGYTAKALKHDIQYFDTTTVKYYTDPSGKPEALFVNGTVFTVDEVATGVKLYIYADRLKVTVSSNYTDGDNPG